jgi:hypothetical protein
MRPEADKLMRAALVAIPGSFQFAQFGFLSDLITFPDPGEPKDCYWPLLWQSCDSLLYVTHSKFDQRTYESLLIFLLMSTTARAFVWKRN